MGPPMDGRALLEELTIQEVILASLADEEFEGVEKEREEAREEIARLKKALEDINQKKHSPLRVQRQREQSEASASASKPSSPDKKRREALSPGEPSQLSRQNSAVMATPSRATGPSDWISPASLTLRNRKRDFSSSDLQPWADDPSSKSRRTTPTPVGGRLTASSRVQSPSTWGDDVEIIDLTGPDVDADGRYVAEQLQFQQEQRHAQEKQDREMAMLLSNQNPQGSAHRTPNSTVGSNPAQTTAFSKLMAAQRSNARGQVQPLPGYEPNENAEFLSHEPAQPFWPPFGSNLPMPNAIVPSQMNQLAFNQSSTPQPQGYYSLGFGPPTTSAMSFGTLGPNPVAFGGISRAFTGSISSPTPSTALRTSSGLFSGLSSRSGLPGVTAFPSPGGSSLSEVISRTSAYDYANGLDEYGDPLPGRLMDYIHDSYHDPRVTEKELDDLLKNIRPDMDIPEKNRDGTPEGLKNSLYPHQSVALTWMKSMEEGTNKGGILADDMGLGKTISTLALMLSRQATSRPKTNLIIGPLALIRQWEEEILKKTKASHRLSVFVYHNKKATTDDLLKYDVVLTTYGTIAQELKRLDKFMEENADRNIDFNDRSVATKFPLLNPRKATFHRVILDEAQCIKNKDTKTAKACHKLKATYRWCLTGTPMMNGILELYSLVVFLRIKPYCVWEEFRRSFGVLFGRNGDPQSVAMSRLRALLKAIMLRRKKNSELDGKPILRLPEKSEEVVYADLTGDERDFYNQLEKKSQVQFNKYLRDGSVGKNYSSILVLLLRLRQACCHPHLNLDVDDAAPASSVDIINLVKKLDQQIVARIKETDDFDCPICYDGVPSPLFFIPCGHESCQQCLTKLVDSAAAMNLQDGTESDKAKCPVCRGLFDPRNCFTLEAFRKVHMPEAIENSEPVTEDESVDDFSSDEFSDSADEFDDEVDKKGNLKDFVIDDNFFDSEDEQEKIEKKKRRKGKKKRVEVKPSMLKSLRQDAVKNKEASKKYIRYLRKTWLPAAKVSECMRLLKEIYATGEKTIVFSQWTLLLDLLEVALWHEDYPGKLARYDGGMSAEKRFAAAHDFREKKEVKVMLVSLRAGNAGLNLTAASRVIIMDPFWNPYIEMQAVDRAYRIGQQNRVKVYRILTRETVEDRIVELQDRKKEIVEAALDEAESMKIGRLNVNELKFLFNARD